MFTRIPTHSEQQAISAARYILLERCPYYAAAAFQLPILVVDGMPGMGCDRKGRVYIGTEALLEPPDEVAKMIEHELWHLLREHAMRLGGLPVREAAAISGCLEINDDLGQQPQPSDINLPNGQVAEWYYRQICDMIDKQGNAPDAGDGCGSGGGGDPGEWEVDDEGNLYDENGDQVMDQNGDPLKADNFEGIARELAARAVAEQLQKQPPGNVPGGLLRWAAEQLGVPELPWQQVLRGLISRGMETSAGRADYTMRRPSRRPTGDGIVRPSMHSPVPKVAVVIDTSGSMSQDDLTAAMRETQGAIQAVGASMHILACDTESADGVQHVKSIGEVVLKGGGGTDMVAGIATALMIDPDVVVVMTDGYTPWPPKPVDKPIIIVLIGDGPFGPDWAANLRVKSS